MRKIVFIDFHGTLAYKSYSVTMKEVLDEAHPDNIIESSDFSEILNGSYPWDTPNIHHKHLNTKKKWWNKMLKKIENAYSELGYEADSKQLANTFKLHYTNPDKYKIYEDSIEGLKTLKKLGCKIYIASNHVPELKKIIRKMPIGKYINNVYTSGKIGYEKPNAFFFEHMLIDLSMPIKCIMIGDNIIADVKGAETAGIQAILIRNSALKANAKYYANDMKEAVEIAKDLLDLN